MTQGVLANLSLSVPSATVKKQVVTSVLIRVSDKAGNWTVWKNISIASLTTPPAVTTKKSVTAKAIATYVKLAIKPGSVVSLKVTTSSSKTCKVIGVSLKGLKTGACKVTVTVKPKTGKSVSKTVTLKVSR